MQQSSKFSALCAETFAERKGYDAENMDALDNLARNLRILMDERAEDFPSARQLAIKATARGGKVSEGSVRNMLTPSKRTKTADKQRNWPSLEKIASVSKVMHTEVWVLLHPNLAKARALDAAYKIFEQASNPAPMPVLQGSPHETKEPIRRRARRTA